MAMTTEEFEELVLGAAETFSLEFKGPMVWDAIGLVKDILAMSNIVDGGHIVIGIDDDSNRVGISDEQAASYDIDTMKDQVASFADPAVDFSAHRVTGADGKQFVVIQVSTFREIPIICKKDKGDVCAGTIYTRSLAGKPASARVSNSNDLREIIEMAIARRRASLINVGIINEPAEYDYEAELGDLK